MSGGNMKKLNTRNYNMYFNFNFFTWNNSIFTTIRNGFNYKGG